MALIICPECKKEISDKAHQCIHCGFPLKEYMENIVKCDEINNSKIGNIESKKVEKENSVHIEAKFMDGYSIIYDNGNFKLLDLEQIVYDGDISKIEIHFLKKELCSNGFIELYVPHKGIKLYCLSNDDFEACQKIKEEYELTKSKNNSKHWCNGLYRKNEVGKDYCDFCGIRLTPYNKDNKNIVGVYNEKLSEIKQEEHVFNGIYKYTLFGGKQEVYCPRCGSEDCSHYKEQKIIPGKTKTQYSANLNPLKPFTFVNKKEKVIRKEQTYTENKFMCNSCGKIFI